MKKLFVIIPLVILLALAGTWFYANQQVAALVDQRIMEFIDNGTYRSLDYEDVSVDLWGDIHLSNLHVIDAAGYEYILEDINITDFDYGNEQPHHLELTASGMRFPAGIPQFGNSPNRALNTYLETVMDADFLPMTFNYRYRYQPEAERQLDTGISFNLPGSFLLTSDSVMRNVSLEQFTQQPQVAADPIQYSLLLQNADLPSADITVRDLGLVDAMMAIQGETLGMDAEDYRQQFLAQLQTMVLFTPQQLQPLAQRFLGSFAAFLEGEKTLRLSIEPEFGGNIQQLQGEILGAFYIGNFARIEEVLNLEIETF